MAITKIIAITARLDNCINYVINADKTEQCLYVTSFNCRADKAFADMTDTQKRWNKNTRKNGVMGYHLIQSFKPNELTPDEAHKYGCEFINRLFADRYEVVLTTHVDKGHLHNHAVFNAVSFMDGKKYRNNFKDYFVDIRGTSDSVCREHNLSVISPDGKGINYAEWQAEQQSKPTIRSQIRADIDEIIPKAINFDMFVGLLRQRGYKVKTDGKYITLLAPFAQKPIRLSSKLGEGYSVEEITDRIANSLYEPNQFVKPPKPYYSKPWKSFAPKKYKGIQALYWRYVYMIRRAKAKKASPKACYILRADVIKLERYVEQYMFLYRNSIETATDLTNFKADTERKITKLVEQRKPLYRLCRTDDVAERIEGINTDLRGLRRDLRLCKGVEENSRRVKENIQLMENMDKVKKDMQRENSDNER